MNKTVKQVLKYLVTEGEQSGNTQWQSISIDDRNPMMEIYDIDLTFYDIKNPITEFSPDLPWAEDHFLERINGQPINPGEQYQNWPYYRGLNNDELFRESGKFSHNYMERYWCKGLHGRRFEYGDLNDIIERLKENPYTRQAYLSVWHPEDQSNHGERVPCTLGYWFYMHKGKLDVKYLIRSCDAYRHFRNDCYMTFRLLQHVASAAQLEVGNMKIWIGSFHCFKSDFYAINKLIKS